MSDLTTQRKRRKIYCVLSSRSLPYSSYCIRSLSENCVEPFDLTLITDSAEDRGLIQEALSQINLVADSQKIDVLVKADLEELALRKFGKFPALLDFREGHPCWRKVTDPLLLADNGEEAIILDPDLYFPNKFEFESTPEMGVLLMWQKPHCLLPDTVVRRAYSAGYRLAHHVDIGVAQLRGSEEYAPWLEDLVVALGGRNIPNAMHVEAIVWSAWAMKFGGGYLSPQHWRCWRNSLWKRLLLYVGVRGELLMEVEPFDRIKCFHGGGPAKWWVPGYLESKKLTKRDLAGRHMEISTFSPLTKSKYDGGYLIKRVARIFGYRRF